MCLAQCRSVLLTARNLPALLRNPHTLTPPPAPQASFLLCLDYRPIVQSHMCAAASALFPLILQGLTTVTLEFGAAK